ncbi:MAG: hypothetical protein ACLP7A_14230 [Desulfobaccales bacterium]
MKNSTAKLGKFLKGIGLILFIAGVLLGLLLNFISNTQVSLPFPIFFLPAIMLVLGVFLLLRARQLEAKAIAPQVIGGSGPKVLYLRSFKIDASVLRQVLWSILLFGKALESASGSEEEQLREALQPFGELIAIGKPGEALPTLGAARLYASDAEWQNVVIGLMQTARLVVVRVGSSGGLLWELQETVKVLNPTKLLLWINLKKKDYEAFKMEADQIFSHAVPHFDEIKRSRLASGFIRFSENWAPGFLPFLQPPFFRSGPKQLQRGLTYTLRPIFEEGGVQWQPPPISKYLISSLLVLLMIFAFIIIMVIIGTLSK